MKKIIFLIFTLLSFAVYSQEPTHVKMPKTFQPGNWYMIGQWDSVSGSYKDTLGFYLEGDTTNLWSNKPLRYNGRLKFDNTIYSNGLSNSGNLISTDGNFYGSNHGWFCGFDTAFGGVLKIASVGKLTGSFLTGTYTSSGFKYIENIGVTNISYSKVVGGVSIKESIFSADTNYPFMSRIRNNRELIYGITDTAHIWRVPKNKTIMSADSGGNHFKVYVPTITKNLTVHGTITSGGLINKDTVISLIDDGVFNFPTTSVGWAEIQCDSSLIEKTWGNVSWNGDGATNLRSNDAKFVNTNTDGNYACFYDGGSYAILKNTSGSTKTYSIKYHYHQ